MTCNDGAETLIYWDPLYLHETRGDSKAYECEMRQEQHRELVVSLHRISGKAAVSGNRCVLMDKLLQFDADERHRRSIKWFRQECIWMHH